MRTVNNPVYEPEIYQHCPMVKPMPPMRGATKADWMDYIADLDAYADGCAAMVEGGRCWQQAKRNVADVKCERKPEDVR